MKFELDVDYKFIQRFCDAGQSEVMCHCNRNHIAIPSYYGWSEEYEGEVDEIIASIEEDAKKDESIILHYDVDSIDIITLAGLPFVLGCDCEGWKPYMEFMVNQRKQIAEFLIDVDKEFKRLQSYEDVIDILSGEYETEEEDMFGFR